MLSPQVPAPPEVAGKVFIPRGHVSSGDYGRAESSGVLATFEPKRTPTQVKKCLVPQLRVRVDDVQVVQIFFFSLDTGEKLDSLTFNLTGNADILIGNADPGDVPRVLKNIITGGNDHDNRTDFDFELYYNLLDGPDDGGGLPIPRAIKFGDPHCYTVKVAPPNG
jgi:hypothetical protein